MFHIPSSKKTCGHRLNRAIDLSSSVLSTQTDSRSHHLFHHLLPVPFNRRCWDFPETKQQSSHWATAYPQNNSTIEASTSSFSGSVAQPSSPRSGSLDKEYSVLWVSFIHETNPQDKSTSPFKLVRIQKVPFGMGNVCALQLKICLRCFGFFNYFSAF